VNKCTSFFSLQLHVAYALLPYWPKAEALSLARYVLPTHRANTKPATPNAPFITKFPSLFVSSSFLNTLIVSFTILEDTGVHLQWLTNLLVLS
jgi:hypothetical protein